LAYSLGATLFQGKKNRQKRSIDYFSVALKRAGQSYDDQKKENLITTTRLYFWLHSLEGSLHETITWVNYAGLQSHCCPQRTNTRVTWDVTILEDHYNRAECPLRTKSCDALVKWLDYDQEKERMPCLTSKTTEKGNNWKKGRIDIMRRI
jgi:hypothetical protein